MDVAQLSRDAMQLKDRIFIVVSRLCKILRRFGQFGPLRLSRTADGCSDADRSYPSHYPDAAPLSTDLEVEHLPLC